MARGWHIEGTTTKSSAPQQREQSQSGGAWGKMRLEKCQGFVAQAEEFDFIPTELVNYWMV